MRALIKGERYIREKYFIRNNINRLIYIDGLIFEVDECLGTIEGESPFLTSRNPSRSLGSGDSQSGSWPDSANPSLVTALSSTAVSSAPNIEP